MKNFFYFIAGIVFFTIISATINTYSVSKKTAEVEKKSGLFIFTDSKPVLDYEYLGTIKAGLTLLDQYQEVIPSIIERAKKKYPDAEAIIYIAPDKADVIKFK